MSAEEFIRRFLLHVLSSGWTRIRHYGFLSPRNKATQLKQCPRLTKTQPPVGVPRTTLEFYSATQRPWSGGLSTSQHRRLACWRNGLEKAWSVLPSLAYVLGIDTTDSNRGDGRKNLRYLS